MQIDCDLGGGGGGGGGGWKKGIAVILVNISLL